MQKLRTIGIIGAGRSANVLIEYLLDYAIQKGDVQLIIAERDIKLAHSKIAGKEEVAKVEELDVTNAIQRLKFLKKLHVCISMLPASMHVPVASDCIGLGTPMLTASYISPQMEELHEQAKENGVLILNEMGVDPGIDHMSAMKVIHEIQEMGGEMHAFESFTGGLVAPESDNNPWNYKFSWNPRNVVIAGQGGAAKFIQEGKYKYIPYNKLFRRTEIVEIEDYGRFEGYANRDSLRYRSIYGLDEIATIFRGTFRRPGYCKSWDYIVQLGMTDDTYELEDSINMTYRDFTNSFLAYDPHNTVELKLRAYLHIDQDSGLWHKLEWLGLFDDTKKIGIANATPAQCLQKILQEKWALEESDKDMVVMWHKFEFDFQGERKIWESSMVAIGENKQDTAMAKTVGLPLGIATKLVLEGKIKDVGVKLPIYASIYTPILSELEERGVSFKEKRN